MQVAAVGVWFVPLGLLWGFGIVDAYRIGKTIAKTHMCVERDPAIAGLLSFIWCGVGQVYNQQMSKGPILLVHVSSRRLSCPIAAFAGMLASLGFAAYSTPTSSALAGAVSVIVTFSSAVLSLVVLGLWVFGIIDGYRVATRKAIERQLRVY